MILFRWLWFTVYYLIVNNAYLSLIKISIDQYHKNNRGYKCYTTRYQSCIIKSVEGPKS